MRGCRAPLLAQNEERRDLRIPSVEGGREAGESAAEHFRVERVERVASLCGLITRLAERHGRRTQGRLSP